jgi:hypothetical protein
VYNLRPMPPEVVVEGANAVLARKGLTNKELVDAIVKEST